MKIEDLLEIKEHEHIERKSAQHNFHFDEFLKYVSALANEGGGKLILGVDNRGHIVGTSVFKNIEKIKTGGIFLQLSIRIDLITDIRFSYISTIYGTR